MICVFSRGTSRERERERESGSLSLTSFRARAHKTTWNFCERSLGFLGFVTVPRMLEELTTEQVRLPTLFFEKVRE